MTADISVHCVEISISTCSSASVSAYSDCRPCALCVPRSPCDVN